MQAIDHIEVRYRRADTVGAWTTFSLQPGQSTAQIPAVQRGETYQIEARAVGKNGAASVWVQQTHVVDDASLAPFAPTGLTALSVADGVHLSWTVSGTQRADVEYDVERTGDISGSPDTGSWVNITNVKATAYTDGITDGVVRWYRVRAIGFQGPASAYSNDISSQNKSVQDGADKTAEQPIVYAGIGNNLIPNGNFLLGNLLGWLVNAASFGSGGMLLNQGGSGVYSAAFSVIPGNKYRFTFLGKVNGAGTQAVTHRVCTSDTYSPNISGGTYSDLLAGGSLTSTIAQYTYDWTCPAGVSYCSLAMYELGTAQLLYTDVSAQDYGAAGEWGADKTGDNTAAGIVGQGDLATINQADTANIVAGAVNASVVFQSTVVVSVPVNTPTIVAQATIATNGGYVKVRVTMMIFGQSSTNFAYPQLNLYKGNGTGIALVFYGNVFVPMDIVPGGGATCVTLEAVDASPAASQQYTVTAYSNTVAMEVNPITLVIENSKV